jgi:glycosyltransferase involved in cell wall biosynthesis/MoaA/NifB/PqqE/SkfB family radical SAM enzyme
VEENNSAHAGGQFPQIVHRVYQDHKMKIILQNQYDNLLGGVETYFQLLVKALLEKGHEVVAVYTFSGKRLAETKGKFKAVYLPGLDLPEEAYYSQTKQGEIKRSLDILEAIVKEEKPDIIHLNNTYYPSQYSLLRRYAPLIQTVHDFFNTCPMLLKMFPNDVCTSPMGAECFRKGCVSPKSIMELWRYKTKYVNREAMKRFDRQLVTTEYMKRMLVSNGFSADKVDVVPLFVEDFGYSAVPSINTVLYVGRLTREKGVLHFLHMLKLLKSNFRAVVAGDGPQRVECEALVSKLGLKNDVTFTGFLNRQQLKEYYLRSSVVVVPSLWPEPFCLVGLEALSYARPVVAYDTGGVSSWLKDSYNGFLIKRGDIHKLGHGVDAILKDCLLCAEMGENGRRIFEERYTEKVHFPRLLEIYEQLNKDRHERGKRPLRVHVNLPFDMAKIGDTVKRQFEKRHYPQRLPREVLPDYNKRVIAFEVKNKIAVVRSYPEEITISTTTRCNMTPPCVICERNERTVDEEGDLDESVFKRLKPIFKFADRIYLHCGGEPLMTKRSYDIIDSVAPPTKIIFNTNGALFTEKTIKHMVDCGVVDIISFSLDAATEKTYKRIRSADFNKVVSHIKTLIDYRNQKNRHKPLLRPLVLMNFCIFRQNYHEVADYVTLAHRLGADGLDFSHLNAGFDWKQQRADYVFDYKNEHVLALENKEDHDQQILRAFELGQQYKIPINFNGNPFIGQLNASKRDVKNEISEVIKWEKKCIAPWNRAVIEADGRVRVCYFHHNRYQTIGRFRVEHVSPHYRQCSSFEEIWNGKEAVSIRKEFLDKGIARRCITKNPCIFQNRT